jgi:hypothetical protein
MVVVELLEGVLSFLFGQFGVGGVSVGAVALLLAGIWYGRELSSIMVGVARWLRIGSVLVGGLAVLVVAGFATGAISLDSGVVGEALDLLGSIAEGL